MGPDQPFAAKAPLVRQEVFESLLSRRPHHPQWDPVSASALLQLMTRSVHAVVTCQGTGRRTSPRPNTQRCGRWRQLIVSGSTGCQQGIAAGRCRQSQKRAKRAMRHHLAVDEVVCVDHVCRHRQAIPTGWQGRGATVSYCERLAVQMISTKLQGGGGGRSCLDSFLVCRAHRNTVKGSVPTSKHNAASRGRLGVVSADLGGHL